MRVGLVTGRGVSAPPAHPTLSRRSPHKRIRRCRSDADRPPQAPRGGAHLPNRGPRTKIMQFLHHWIEAAAVMAVVTVAQARPVPLLKTDTCPLGYYSSGTYCVPTDRPGTRGAIQRSGSACPLGWYRSGGYCVSSPSNQREAIQKSGKSCPLGWYSSGSYCVRGR
jgi:hypothetical protein